MEETEKKQNPFVRFFNAKINKSLWGSIISVLIGILVGFLVMLIAIPTSTNRMDPIKGLGIIFSGPTRAGNPLRAFGNMLFYTAPLIFTGLSVAIAYKTGLFNIGAPGQFILGTLCSLEIALSIHSPNRVVGVFVWLLALIVGMIAGVLWGLIPGALKAYFGINEVIICIMTNWIAANMLTWIFSTQSNLINTASGKSGYLITTSATNNYTPTLGLGKITNNSYLDMSIIIAIIFAVLIWIVLNKTTLGYSMKSCGLNRFASKYAGISDKLNILISMGIAGGLAALGGCLYYLNPRIELQFKSVYQSLPAYGFDGISAAFLANCNPIGVIISSLLIRYLATSGANLAIAGYNKYFADIITAVVIYLAGFTSLLQNVMPDLVLYISKTGPRRRKRILTFGLRKMAKHSTDNISDEEEKEELVGGGSK